MVFSRILLWLTILCCGSHFTNAWRPFKFHFNYIETTGNPLMVELGASIKNNSVGHSVVDVFYKLARRVPAPILVNVRISTTGNRVEVPIRINMTTDVCEVFKKPNLSPILRGIYKAVTSHIDMPLKCPVEPSVMYHVSSFGDVEEQFPPYIPLSRYKLQYRFYHPAKDPYSHLASMVLTFTIMKNDQPRPRSTRRQKAKQ